ncbi:MAG: hypothetical protein A2Y77_13695 [Planctomycetes bacterium RBG_13_62_9]|nr:MAG: hypothetical protein A2Y77_13695 [Planctomycetes bacterium RBG_13_62_9]
MHQDRFHYCLEMESVEWALSGVHRRPSGMAASFSNPVYLRKRCKTYLQKIKKRVNRVVTTDESLRLLLVRDIDRLGEEFSRLSKKNNNDVEIFAAFFALVVHLLGWAYVDGTFYRTPIYHQTEKQRWKDIRNQVQSNLRPGELFDFYGGVQKRKREIIKRLLSEGASRYEVALIMGLAVSNVKALENA